MQNKLILILSLLSFEGHSQTTFFTGGNICKSEPWHLVFNDEFNGDTVNRNVWMTYYPCHADWTDQCESSRVGARNLYLDNNVVVSDGSLKLIAKHETSTWYSVQKEYTSGVIYAKFEYRYMYGKFEIRCKIPSGKGFFPAFWMFGGNGKGTATELDVFEISGGTPSKHKVGFVKYNETEFLGWTQYDYEGIDFTKAFHVFAAEWDPFFITFTVDNVEVFKANRFYTLSGSKVMRCCVAPGVYTEDPFYPSSNNNNIGPIANFSIDEDVSTGNVPGPDTPFPSIYEIDYIRIYQRDSTVKDNYDCEVRLFPNPVLSKLSIRKNKMFKIEVINLIGQVLIQKEVSGDECEIDVANLAKGIYFVEVESFEGLFVSRFIKD